MLSVIHWGGLEIWRDRQVGRVKIECVTEIDIEGSGVREYHQTSG